jgi:hypothetical protein
LMFSPLAFGPCDNSTRTYMYILNIKGDSQKKFLGKVLKFY